MRLASRNIADEVVARILIAARAVRSNAPAELSTPAGPRVVNGVLPPGFKRVDIFAPREPQETQPEVPPLDQTGVDVAKVAQGEPMSQAVIGAQIDNGSGL